MTFDTILRNGLYFDGTGAPGVVRDVGIRDGRVAEVAESLDSTGCADIVEAGGMWVLPGLVDIHTHYDIEVLDSPALAESLRHGVTTIIMGSCSLSTVYADSVDVGDLYGRVEAIPRMDAIRAVDRHKDWTSVETYIASLERRPLGPNIGSFMGHSDMRVAVMGLDRATRKDVKPTAAELARMEGMLTEALDAGYVGLSSQQLLFDKLDGDRCRSRTLPSTYAKHKELKRLKNQLRKRGRVIQSGPDINNPMNLVSQAFQSLGWGRPQLKTSLLSAADIKANPMVIGLLAKMGRLMIKLGGGENFRWQHLPVPFEVYADGIDLPIFEEFGSGAAAMHLKEEIEKQRELMQDPDYRRRFRKDYESKWGPRVWHRDFFDAEIVEAPDPSLVGKSFGQVGVERGGLHPVDAFLDLMVEYGKQIRWRTTISNHRPEMLKMIAQEPSVQVGFSDAGAHLRNMAFYNFGLRLLRHVYTAQQEGNEFLTVEAAIHRMSREIAEWYGLDAGRIQPGDRADLFVLDPAHLDDTLDTYHEAVVPQFSNLSRMVNRNDQTVRAVYVSGRAVFRDGRPTDVLGHQRTGSFLRAHHPAPPVPAERPTTMA